jgi:hypothetical protein
VIAVLIVTKVPRLRSAGWAAALGLLLAGAAGNLCDRLMRAPGARLCGEATPHGRYRASGGKTASA